MEDSPLRCACPSGPLWGQVCSVSGLPSQADLQGISSPGIDKVHLMGPCNHGGCNGALCRTGRLLKLTAIWIVDRTGKIEREGVVSSDPEAIAAFVKSHAPHVARVGLETGATSTWLWTELNKMGLPVICIDARHAKAALKMQINKSDRNCCARRQENGSPPAGICPRAHLQQIMEPRRPLRQFRNGTRHAASDKTRDYLVFGSLMLRNWRVASTTDFSIGNRSADEPPT